MPTTGTNHLRNKINEFYDSEARLHRQTARLASSVNNVILQEMARLTNKNISDFQGRNLDRVIAEEIKKAPKDKKNEWLTLQKMQEYIKPYSDFVANGNPFERIKKQSTGNLDADMKMFEEAFVYNRTIFYNIQLTVQGKEQFEALIDANPRLKQAILNEIRIKRETVNDHLDNFASIDNHTPILFQRAPRYMMFMSELVEEAKKPQCNATAEFQTSLQNTLDTILRRNEPFDAPAGAGVIPDKSSPTPVESEALKFAEDLLRQLDKKFSKKILGTSSDAKFHKAAINQVNEFKNSIFLSNRDDLLLLKRMANLLGGLQAELTLHPNYHNAQFQQAIKSGEKKRWSLSNSEKNIFSLLADLISQEKKVNEQIRLSQLTSQRSSQSSQAMLNAAMINNPPSERPEPISRESSPLTTPTASPDEKEVIKPVRKTKQPEIEPIEPSSRSRRP